jgi:hypothetical protein
VLTCAGLCWLVLACAACAGLCWLVLACAGLCWLVLDCAWLCWLVLGCAGLCWLVLACAGLCWLVPACAGLCWLVLACAGLCWLELAYAGLDWLVLAYVQRGSKVCFVVVVVHLADTLIRILHYCLISPCVQHIAPLHCMHHCPAALPGRFARCLNFYRLVKFLFSRKGCVIWFVLMFRKCTTNVS